MFRNKCVQISYVFFCQFALFKRSGIFLSHLKNDPVIPAPFLDEFGEKDRRVSPSCSTLRSFEKRCWLTKKIIPQRSFWIPRILVCDQYQQVCKISVRNNSISHIGCGEQYGAGSCSYLQKNFVNHLVAYRHIHYDERLLCPGGNGYAGSFPVEVVGKLYLRTL